MQNLKKLVEERKAAIAKAQKLPDGKNIPSELLFASGSALDPHISPAAAEFQLERVAHARNLDAQQQAEVANLISSHTSKRRLGFLGEPYVNVLGIKPCA